MTLMAILPVLAGQPVHMDYVLDSLDGRRISSTETVSDDDSVQSVPRGARRPYRSRLVLLGGEAVLAWYSPEWESGGVRQCSEQRQVFAYCSGFEYSLQASSGGVQQQ